MKNITSLFLFVLFILLLNTAEINAQNIEQTLKAHEQSQWFQLLQSDHPNYLKVTNAYDAYFKKHKYVKTDAVRAYLRWSREVGNDYDENGNVLEISHSPLDLKIIKRESSISKNSGNSGNWEQIGPFTFDMEAHYRTNTQGTVRCIQQDPNNPNKVFLGCYNGGVWLSTNSGDNWSNVTKDLLVSTVCGVCISPANTNVVYASSKEGVIKSIDGGLNWEFTTFDDRVSYPKGDSPTSIAIAHDDETKVIHASKTGLWVTSNGGATWTKKFSTHVYDVEFHPTNSNIAYATVEESFWANFYKTTDGGTTWKQITNGYPTTISGHKMLRSLIEVSPASPNAVWVISGGEIDGEKGVYGVYKSTNAGELFTRTYRAVPGTAGNPNFVARATNGISSEVGQLSWDFAFAVSNTNPDFMIAGTINMWKTTDGGLNWTYVNRSSSGQTMYHMDFQCAEIYDTNIWAGNDGGIVLSTDNLATLQDKSFGGFAAQQVWGMDRSWKNDLMNAGFYHGQIVLRDDNTYVGGWYNILGADASSTYINYGDDRYMYGNSYGGRRIIRSTSRLVGANSKKMLVTAPKGYKQNEMLNHFYYGLNYTHMDNVFQQSKDEGGMGEWTVLSTFTKTPSYIHPSYADADVLYVIENRYTLWRSTNGGESWINRTPPYSLTSGRSLGNVCSDGLDPNIIWCSIPGKHNGPKVLKSNDGGVNWTDFSGPSGNLPSYDVLSLAHQLGTDGGVYLGNSCGVWYRNNTMTKWVNFSDGLPAATPVTHIRFKYSTGRISIGSLRSIFEGDVYETSAPIAHPITAQKLNAIGSVKFADHSVCASDATYNWTFSGGTPTTSSDEKPIIEYSEAGEYDVTLSVTDQYGTDTKTYSQFINVQEPVVIQLDAAYSFDGNAKDISGNGWDATEDGLTFVNDDERGSVAEFNSSYSTITGHPGFDGATSRTISAWIKTTTPDKSICAFGTKLKSEKWSFRLFSNGKLRVEVEGGYIYGSTVLTDGKWHHVACTFEDDGTPDVTDVKLFVDGQLEVIESQSSSAVNTTANSTVWIGKDFATTRNFIGQMDNLYLRNYALSEAEIEQEYSTAIGIEEHAIQNIKIISNKKTIYVENSGETKLLKVFNMTGKCVHSFQMPNGRKTFSVDQTGIYVVAIYDKQKIQTKKIFVTK